MTEMHFFCVFLHYYNQIKKIIVYECVYIILSPTILKLERKRKMVDANEYNKQVHEHTETHNNIRSTKQKIKRQQ